VRTIESVPLSAVLPTCALAIHHGGSGTAMTVAVHGLPQLVIPRFVDGIPLTRRLVGAGVARQADEDTPAAELADHIRALLGDRDHQRAAERLRDEIRTQPAVTTLGERIEQLTARPSAARASPIP
jgi:UDP:flavonoid glycosyltransferase YjiC (YdhE family)